MAAPLAVVAVAAAAGSEPTGVVDDSLPLVVGFGLCYKTVA